MVVGADGVTRAVIDWEWFKKYRDTLLVRVAAGKKVIPEIYQRYLNPTEKLLTLAQNIYGTERPAAAYGRTICTTSSPKRLSDRSGRVLRRRGGISHGRQSRPSRREPRTACQTEVGTYKSIPTTC
jgi:hypothetical protein